MSSMDSAASPATVRATLATLKDVVGITGSFVCTQSGHLVAREIPSIFDDAVLEEVGSRLLRLGEAFGAAGDDLDVAVMRFRDHRVYVKSLVGGVLCILTDGVVNMPALRMAANLVGRRVAHAVALAQADPPPLGTPMADTAAPAAHRPREAPPGMRRFRGRTVD